jgi:hypothetical protein
MSLKPVETHQANSTANRLRKNVQHIHRWINPVREPVITNRWVKAGDLPSELGGDLQASKMRSNGSDLRSFPVFLW